MSQYRGDSSLESSNAPTWNNLYRDSDFGLYSGIVRGVTYTDDKGNNSKEVLYTVQIIGGSRDGQLFMNCQNMCNEGGQVNYEERILHPSYTATGVDFSSNLYPVPLDKQNGDMVLLLFLNGDPLDPVIIGKLRHPSNPEAAATRSDGPRLKSLFNGISTEIDKDGVFTWKKSNGAFRELFPNPNNSLTPFQNQFVTTPGQEDAFTLSINNENKLNLAFKLGLSVELDAVGDKFSIRTAVGTSVTLDGASDSFTIATKLGTAVEISGSKDLLSLSTKAGALVAIDGLKDSVNISTKAGAILALSAASGVSLTGAAKESLTMTQGTFKAESAGGAQLELSQAGQIKLGNASADALQILSDLIESLSTATYSGFGAPGSNVAQLTQLLAKIKLITG